MVASCEFSVSSLQMAYSSDCGSRMILPKR